MGDGTVVRSLTRRGFTKAAGATMVAFGLGESRSQAQGSGRRVVYASALGCVLDGRTDDTGKLNDLLATATAERPVLLVIDGMAAVRGLLLAAGGHTTIEGLGWDTGIVVLPGSEADGVRIGPYAGENEGAFGKAAKLTASSITLRRMRIDGGRESAGGPNLRATSDGGGTTPAGRGVYGALLTNVRDVVVEDVLFVNAPLYSLCLSNCAGVQVTGCRFEAKRDGVHIDGPAKDVAIERCTFATRDDGIALNAPEGYGGTIEDVRIRGCVAEYAWTLLRIYTSNREIAGDTQKVRRVVVSDCTGSTQNPPFNLGIENGMASDAPAQVEDLLIAGCSMSCDKGFATIATTFGALTFRDCTWHAPGEAKAFGIRVAGAVSELVMENFTLLRNADGHSAVGPLEVTSAVAEVVLQGVRVVDADGAAFGPVPFWLSLRAPVQRLRLESVEMEHVASLLNAATGAWSEVADGGVRGAGVLGSGVRVPEAKAGEGVEFVSAETGEASVKVGGVVRRIGVR